MITGEKREVKDFSKKVGMFQAQVLTVNPDREELEAIYGTTIEKDPEYLSEKEVTIGKDEQGEDIKQMVNAARISFILQDVKSKSLFNLSFYLEDRERWNKDRFKRQFINNVGSTSWGEDETDLPDWFSERPYRVAKVGEEELYNFVRAWFSDLDFKKESTKIDLEFDKMIEGDLSVLQGAVKEKLEAEVKADKSQIGVVALATIHTKEKDDEVIEYQSVYNRAFLPAYTLKVFRTKKFTSEVLEALRKKTKDIKNFERFVIQVTDLEYGVKDFYKLTELSDYNPEDNIVAKDSVHEPASDADGSGY